MIARIIRYPIVFARPAITSRNTFVDRDLYFVILEKDGKMGIGEAAPLLKLSVDDTPDFEQKLCEATQKVVDGFGEIPYEELTHLPAGVFGLETALADMKNGGKRQIFDSPFAAGKPIEINGLVWMSTIEEMLEEAYRKVEDGFNCIKFKIGALDFGAECRMLELIRKRWSAFKLEIRLDANGAFSADDALSVLKDLSRFQIHSIEQPIAPKQWESMAKLCKESKIDIALDEELIGLQPESAGNEMLKVIHPRYIILKPSLIGGFKAADVWIKNARMLNIGWWATSALESNIGLNAIAQWVSGYQTQMPQGLGTGSLYKNNLTSPLKVIGQQLTYSETGWNTKPIFEEGTEIFTYVR